MTQFIQKTTQKCTVWSRLPLATVRYGAPRRVL